VSIEPPHGPHDAPEIDLELFREKALRLSPNVPNSKSSDEHYLETVRAYYAQIANLDRNIGRILDALEESGQADHTIVFYFSDHGEMMGSHGRMGKSRPEAGSSRIPLIVRYPGVIPAGRETDGYISGVDLLPTLLGLLGATVPDYAEGVDLSSFVRGECSDGAHETLLQFEHNFYDSQPKQTFRTLIRSGWHYTCFLTEGPSALYNLIEDPHQLDNRIGDPECAAVREELHHRLERKLAQLGDNFFDRMSAKRGNPAP
jgi:arylsulfatase A-like enzyme